MGHYPFRGRTSAYTSSAAHTAHSISHAGSHTTTPRQAYPGARGCSAIHLTAGRSDAIGLQGYWQREQVRRRHQWKKEKKKKIMQEPVQSGYQQKKHEKICLYEVKNTDKTVLDYCKKTCGEVGLGECQILQSKAGSSTTSIDNIFSQ